MCKNELHRRQGAGENKHIFVFQHKTDKEMCNMNHYITSILKVTD